MKYREFTLSHLKQNTTKVCEIAYGKKKSSREQAKPVPVMITRFGRPFVTLVRESNDLERLEDVKKGKISWEDFRQEILQQGFKQIIAGGKVLPADVINAEKVQTDKNRLQLDTAGFMLQAAKYFSGAVYKCEHCGHEMLPDVVPNEPIKQLS